MKAERMIRSAGSGCFTPGWLVACLLAAALVIPFWCRPAMALIGPDWYAYKMLNYSVGESPGVTVQEPVDNPSGSGSVIRITVENQWRRLALATILREEVIATAVEVVDPGGAVEPPFEIFGSELTQQTIIKLLYLVAFRDNPYFHSVEVGMGFFPSVYFITTAAVVQFFIDDLSDFYGMGTFVAEECFWECLRTPIGSIEISTSTELIAGR